MRPRVGAIARLEYHRRLRRDPRVAHPERERERRVPREAAEIGEMDVVLAVELRGLAGMPLDQRHLVLPLSMVGGAGREVLQRRPLELLEVELSREVCQGGLLWLR